MDGSCTRVRSDSTARMLSWMVEELFKLVPLVVSTIVSGASVGSSRSLSSMVSESELSEDK